MKIKKENEILFLVFVAMGLCFVIGLLAGMALTEIVSAFLGCYE